MSAVVAFALFAIFGAVLFPSMVVFKISRGGEFTLEILSSIITTMLALFISKNLKKEKIQILELRNRVGGDSFYIRKKDLNELKRKPWGKWPW